MKFLAVLLSLFMVVPAWAQNMPIYQTGLVTPGHVLMVATNGVAQDAGPSTAGNINSLGITGTGTPFCINDAVISSPSGYHQFCVAPYLTLLGSTGAFLTYNAYGGATPGGFFINLNGVNYPIPGSAGANVVGPVSPAPTVCDAVTWNGGTNVKDGGAPPAMTVTSNAALQALSLTNFCAGAVVRRQAFWSGSIQTPVDYILSASNCSAADNGAQVQPTVGTGCWIAQLPNVPDDPSTWGVVTASSTPFSTSSMVGSPIITGLSSTVGFAAGQAVAVMKAGAVNNLAAPTGLTIGSIPVTGSTTRCYVVAAYYGVSMLSVPSTETCTTTAPSTLGFPFDTSNANQYIPLSWTASSGATGYIIYEGSTGAETFADFTTQTSFNDFGHVMTEPVQWPSTPVTGSGQSDALKTTILTVGSTTLTLNANAGTTSASALVINDNAAALQAALNSTLPLELKCGNYPLFSGLTVNNNNQRFTGINAACVTLQFYGSGYDQIAHTSSGNKLFNFTEDMSNAASGWGYNCNGALKLDAKYGTLVQNNAYNGVIFQAGCGSNFQLGQLNMTTDIRGQQQLYFTGTSPATGLIYLYYFQDARSYTAQCIELNGNIISIFGTDWTCQESPGGANGNAEFAIDNAIGAANNPRLIQITDNLALNECPNRCGYIDTAVQVNIYRLYSQGATGNAAANWLLTSNSNNVDFVGGSIFGGDLDCVDIKGFMTQFVNMSIYACSQSSAGTYSSIEIFGTANGTSITGGSNFAITAGSNITSMGYGIKIDASSQNTTINGGLWLGRMAPIDDLCSPNTQCNVIIAGLPYGSPPTTVINHTGNQTWTAATYPQLYSINGIAVLARGGTVGNNFTDTTDTATNIINNFPAAFRTVGQQFHIRVQSINGGIMTIQGGTGVTIAGTSTVPAGSSTGMTDFADFIGTITNTGSPAVTIYGCSQAAGNQC